VKSSVFILIIALSFNFMLAGVPMAEPFGRTGNGVSIEAYTLVNRHGVRLRAINYGATVLSIETPDRDGRLADIVLGFKTLDEYVASSPYFGAVVGRYANRIAGGRFMLEGHYYQLAINNLPGGFPCTLHGGLKGLDKVIWKSESLVREGAQGVKFHYVSHDGEEGFPGTLDLTVTYWLTDADEWQIEYRATTDRATPINLTQHSYFNLKGEGNGDILNHQLMLAAKTFTPVTAGLIPTGKLQPVVGTPLDFTRPHAIGDRVNANAEQILFGGGYDHNWVLDHESGKLALAATVYEPTTGRVLEVLTTEPGIQFYCGNFLDGKLTGKAGKPYRFRDGFCLETQHYPDSPNQPTFPSTILHPGNVMVSKTIYRFSTRQSSSLSP